MRALRFRQLGESENGVAVAACAKGVKAVVHDLMPLHNLVTRLRVALCCRRGNRWLTAPHATLRTFSVMR